QKVWKRIVVVAAGPAVNIVLAFLILFGVYLANGRPQLAQTVGETKPGMPAAKGLQPGDRVIAIAGQSFPGLPLEKRLERFAKIVGAHKCAGKQVDGCVATTPVKLEIQRDGQTKTLSVYPHYDKEAERALVGFSYGTK